MEDTWQYWNLKFSDQDEFNAVMMREQPDDDGDMVQVPKYNNVAVFGQNYHTDGEGNVTMFTEWLANIACDGEFPAELLPYRLTEFPKNPKMVWDTIYKTVDI